jgi:hypothetical protein
MTSAAALGLEGINTQSAVYKMMTTKKQHLLSSLLSSALLFSHLLSSHIYQISNEIRILIVSYGGNENGR